MGIDKELIIEDGNICDRKGRTIFYVEYNKEERCWDVWNGEGISPSWGWPTGYSNRSDALEAAIELSKDYLLDEKAKKNDNRKPGLVSLIKGVKNPKPREKEIQDRIEQLSEVYSWDD